MSLHVVLVTGGAGFLGVHLIELLLASGKSVIALDALWTGSKEVLHGFKDNDKFRFVEHDVVYPFPDHLPIVDEIYHLACPGSPEQFTKYPLRILETCFIGTQNALEFGLKCSAKVLIASTSEIYGNALVCPQPETYFGNVNTFGPRSCYDEGKRVAESLAYAYHHEKGARVRIARIFNAYGPGLAPSDGRVVSNFMIAALRGQPILVYGDGQASRCFQFATDCVRGLKLLMNSKIEVPVNIGNEHETKIGDLAIMVRDLVADRMGKPKVEIRFLDGRQDDPIRRVPDARVAREKLGWGPKVSLAQGLDLSLAWYEKFL